MCVGSQCVYVYALALAERQECERACLKHKISLDGIFIRIATRLDAWVPGLSGNGRRHLALLVCVCVCSVPDTCSCAMLETDWPSRCPAKCFSFTKAFRQNHLMSMKIQLRHFMGESVFVCWGALRLASLFLCKLNKAGSSKNVNVKANEPIAHYLYPVQSIPLLRWDFTFCIFVFVQTFLASKWVCACRGRPPLAPDRLRAERFLGNS